MDIKTDLFFAAIAGEHMDDYLHSETLFYPIDTLAIVATALSTGKMTLPQLSIGTWLEVAWRLTANPLDAIQRAQLETVRNDIQTLRKRVGDIYVQKARREFKSRLDSWAWYLDDTDNAGRYSTQVHQRLKLALLMADVPQTDGELRRLTNYDMRLRAKFRSGQFVFDSQLQTAAPVQQYWWLYGRL